VKALERGGEGLFGSRTSANTCHITSRRPHATPRSCLMGGCCALRCFNAPHSWQLGWGSPLAVLNSATFPVGVPLSFFLPSQQSVGGGNMIVLQVGRPASGSGPYALVAVAAAAARSPGAVWRDKT
jgi:hypothetical protein